ncbi:MAG: hypothetical protein PHC88_03435 [Terrimicrobiaceae bacterium]|nr:hypothetical protein [Terrimicrobiaceae bacterium]
MKVAAAPETNYVLIDLGKTKDVGTPQGVNDRAKVLLERWIVDINGHSSRRYYAFENGMTSDLGANVRIGPLQDGTTYSVQDEQFTNDESNGTTSIRQFASGDAAIPYYGSADNYHSAGMPIPYILDTSFLPGFLYSYYLIAYAGAAAHADTRQGVPIRIQVGYGLGSVNDSHVFTYSAYKASAGPSLESTLTPGAYWGANTWGVIPASGGGAEYGHSGGWVTYGTPSTLDPSTQGPINSQGSIGFQTELNPVEANAQGAMMAHAYSASALYGYDVYFIAAPTTAPLLVPNCTYAVGLTPSTIGQGEGPYFVGTLATGTYASPFFASKLYCYNNGAPVSFDLKGMASAGASAVAGRSISDHLVIPLGNAIWRNGRKRPLADLCKNIKEWSNVSINRISPTNAILVGTAKKASDEHALLLVPYEFKEVNPASGFDGESVPNWLMVPKDQQNWTKAITPANANLEIKFKVVPGPGGATVTPDHTNQSPETLTVSSPTLGDDSSVVIGIGTAFGTEGLKLSVKKYQANKTVIIHAVTQRYGPTDYMPLQPGEGIAGQVCIRKKSSVLWSVPGNDDVSDGNTVTTGPDGVSDTHCDSHDEEVIPFGNGIHKDISPTGKPSSATLKAYLDRVFGIQTNTYVNVVEGDAITANYDLNKNKLLDVLDANGVTSYEEDKIIINRGEPYHVYYVKDFISGRNGVFSHNVLGATHAADSQKLTFMRDGSWDMLNVAAHEIGHLFKLEHSNERTLSNGQPNPTFLPNSDAKKRLMYYQETPEAPILLIKPEWDIINP